MKKRPDWVQKVKQGFSARRGAIKTNRVLKAKRRKK
jgi:hypothetical protein